MTLTNLLAVIGGAACIYGFMQAAVLFTEWLEKKERELKIYEDDDKGEK